MNSCVLPLASESVIIKHQPNSFYETTLASELEKVNAKELVIAGMMTHMCVDTTVRAAYDRQFAITVLSDACATRDLEFNGQVVHASDVQNAYMAALQTPFANIQTVQQFCRT